MKGWVALFQVFIMVLAVLCIGVSADSRIDPIYMNGKDVTVKVFPTGSFIVNPLDFPSRFYETSSSFWSFKIDDKIVDSYSPLTIDNVVTPVRKTPDGGVKLQYILNGDVLVDLVYREAGPAAEIVVTFINLDQTAHVVGLRHLYDLKDKVVTPSGEPPVTYEKIYVNPGFGKVDIFEQGQRAGSLSIGTSFMADPPSKVIFGLYQETRDTNWDYKVNQSKELGDNPSILTYWEDMSLQAGGAVSVRHFFGSDAPIYIQEFDDLSIESVNPEPIEVFIGKTRTIRSIARNSGTRTRTVDINFVISDDKGYYIANGTVTKSLPAGTSTEAVWRYTAKKVAESRAIVTIEPSADVTAGNNIGQAVVVAKPSPYKVRLTFEDNTRIQYVSIDSGQKARVIVNVENKGTVEDTVVMSVSSMPTDWYPTFNRSEVFLGPGDKSKIEVVIHTEKENDYYNYGIDVIGTSKGGDISDKVLIFISFADIIAKGGGNSSIGGNITPVHKDPKVNNTQPFIPDPPDKDSAIKIDQMQVIMGVLIFMAVMIGAVAVYQIYILGSKLTMKGILEDLYKKLYKSDTSDAYRKAIFKTYEQMCKEMAQVGHERGRHLTPKEFEKQIREYLPIDKKNLHTLTKLFEEARYSDHAFNEKKKRKALKALKGIITSLEDVTTFEDVKERRWFRKNT